MRTETRKTIGRDDGIENKPKGNKNMAGMILKRRTKGIFFAYVSSSSALRPYSSGTSSSLMSALNIFSRRKYKMLSVRIPMIGNKRKYIATAFLASWARSAKTAHIRRLNPALKAKASLDEYAMYLTCLALLIFSLLTMDYTINRLIPYKNSKVLIFLEVPEIYKLLIVVIITTFKLSYVKLINPCELSL
jgi:hypothetical protein